MGDDAKKTDIPDADLAHFHLRAMGIQTEDMQQRLKGIVDQIAALELDKPWGHTGQYKDAFEAQYFGGKDKGGGPQFVRDNVKTLGDETLHGLAMADWAITASVELDTSSAALYHVDGTDQLGQGMVNTENGIATAVNNQGAQQKAQQ